MADFEGLIRQALARQNDADPAVREKVYQSSRRALAKMIAGAGVQPPEIINRQRQALENAIERIEAGYAAAARPAAQARPAPPSAPRPPTPGEAAGQPASRPPAPPPPAPSAAAPLRQPSGRHGDAGPTERQFDPSLSMGPESGSGLAADDDLPEVERQYDYPPDHGETAHETRPLVERLASRRALLIAAAAVGLVVVGILLYLLAANLLSFRAAEQPQRPAASEPARGSGTPRPQTGSPAEDAGYITILSPADTASLETAGRGRAEIVNQSNLEMIRLTSLRAQDAPGEPAPPILVKLDGGVMAQIAGRRVTVEILAKSGSPGPATFAVGCEFAGRDLCGRKRFRVGIQPEAIVFTIDVDQDLDERDPAHLTISTDIIASVAGETGEGEPVDVAYARLRVSD